MECPHCGFMNLLDTGECVRCRKPLPAAGKDTPLSSSTSSLDLSEVKIERVPERTEPPAFPEAGANTAFAPLSPPTESPNEPAGEDTATAELPFPGPVPDPVQAPAPEPEPRLARDESSATYEGSDPELKELSRFFHQVKKEREAEVQAVAPEESPAPAEIEPEERSEESDSFVPEFKETLLPGMGEGEPSLPGEETRPGVEESQGLSGRRLLAGAVDLGIHGVIWAVLYFGAAAALSPQGLDFSAWLFRLALPLFLVVLVIFFGYQLFFLTTAGQTPGQMLLGLRVVTNAGGVPDLGRSLARSFWVLVCGLPLTLGLIPFLFHPRGLSPADQWSRTRVIRA